MSHFDCTLCPLGSMGTRAVEGEGPKPADIMLVGEAPGYNEARLGRPFVGKAGQLLDRILDAAGLSRKDVYITNTVKHRPPENRTPVAHEVATCRIFLDEEYEQVKPKVTVLMGGTASREIFNVSSTKANGVWRFTDGRVYVGMVHPSYLQRGRPASEIQEVVEIFKKVREYVETN